MNAEWLKSVRETAFQELRAAEDNIITARRRLAGVVEPTEFVRETRLAIEHLMAAMIAATVIAESDQR